MSQPATAVSPSNQLSQHFEQLLQQGNSEQFLSEVAVHCSSCTESPWEVLAVVDQLYRRRKLSPQLFRLARISIERRALGFHEPADRRVDVPAPAAQVATPPGPPVAAPPAIAQPADNELQRLRAELARAHVEAAALRQRAPRAQPLLQRQLAQMRKAGIPRPALIAVGCALAALAAVLFTQSNTGVERGRTLPAPAAGDPLAGSAAIAPAKPVTARPGELSFDQERYVVGPQDTQVVIGIRRTLGTDGEVGLEWRASNGGARAGRDFAPPVPASLTLKARQDAAQLTIPILRNPDRKHTEFFDIRLVRGVGGATLGPQKRVTVFILPGAGGKRAPSGRRAGG